MEAGGLKPNTWQRFERLSSAWNQAKLVLGDQPEVARALADFRARQTEEVARNDDPRVDISSTGFA